MREFPVIYVPFGLIEWHGRHLPQDQRSFMLPAISPEHWWMV